MRRRVAFLTCVVAVSLSWGEPISITGAVKDSVSKAPISGAIVRLRVNDNAVDTTDAAGAFALNLATAGAAGRAAAGPASGAPAFVDGGIQVALAAPGRVVVTGYALDGRQRLRLERDVVAGRHVIGCGAAAPGVALYRVRAAGSEFVLRQAQAGDIAAARTGLEGSFGRGTPLTKEAAFGDTLVASRLGYASRRVVLSSTTVADMQIELSSAAAYATVNVATGGVTYAAAVPDLETNDAYKTSLLVMRRIPAGTYMMGDEVGGHQDIELPVHKVNITKDMYVGVFEVTNAQWSTIMGSSPSRNQGAKNPVDNETWNDICLPGNFLPKLNSRSSLKFRLPTEAEWQYCCKAGTSTNYYYGNEPDGAWMWTSDNGGGGSHEVGTTAKKPNPWGLYDMHGNVWEWCSDWLDQEYFHTSPVNDPQGPLTAPWGDPNAHRLLISGSYCYDPDKARSSRRGSATADHVSWCSGFRIVATAPGQ